MKVYYQTTSQRDVCGRAPCAVARGENFDNVHSIGKKTTKYLEFQQSTAPLLSRDACHYHKEFTPHPLGDCEMNRALAQQFKGGLAAGGKAGIDRPLDGMSINETDLRAPRAEGRQA